MWEAIGGVILTLVFISLWSKIKEDNEYPNGELENEKENSSEKSENDEKEIYIDYGGWLLGGRCNCKKR